MAVAERVSERVERLRTALEEPLLVTTGVNVQYLIGFQSSNAAVYVDDERLLLFTDFRYAEAARSLDGVEFVQSQRSLLKTIGETMWVPCTFPARREPAGRNRGEPIPLYR